MLKESQVSLIMTDMQGLLIEKLEKDGFIFPTLIIMNNETMISIDDLIDRYQCILNIEYSSNELGIYITRLTLRNRDINDDEAILRVISEITLKHQPDAVGYFAQCLYKPMNAKEYAALTTDSMNTDHPEAIRVFHNCFFVNKGDDKGYLMITPYKLSESKKEDTFHFQDKTKFTVTEIHKCWETPTSILETRIPNPYL